MNMLRNQSLVPKRNDHASGRRNLPRAAAALSLLLTGCSGGDEASEFVLDTSAAGSSFEFPTGSGNFLLSDEHQGGDAQELRLTRCAWGRLVQVAGLGPQETLIPMYDDFVIAPSIGSDVVNYRLDTNPVTAQQTLVILRRVDDPEAPAFDEFFSLLFEAENNLLPINAMSPDQAGVFSLVARNAAVVIQFDDLIDPNTVVPDTLNVLTGVPSILPLGGRLIPDPNHGGLADFDGDAGPEFYPTRVIIDPTLTEIEALSLDEVQEANGTGFPASVDTSLANVTVRIPSRLVTTGGQSLVLANPSGHFVSTANNGPVDFSLPSLPVVRGFRSGSSTDTIENTVNNGFLVDNVPPQLIGQTPVVLLDSPESMTPGDPEGVDFILPRVQFGSLFCAQTPEIGDVISLSEIQLFAEILEQPAEQVQGLLTQVRVRLLLFPQDWNDPGRMGTLEWELAGAGQPGDFRAAFDPVSDAGQAGCFVSISPFPSNLLENPLEGLLPNSEISLRFSEPVDPASVSAFDSVTLTRSEPNPNDDPPLSTDQFVVGRVVQSPDLQTFTFVPDLDLAHELGVEEDYFLSLLQGDAGPTDLAGNGLTFDFPNLELLMDASSASVRNGGRVSRFRAVDEEPPIGDNMTGALPEWSGQHLYQLDLEQIRPRPVSRFQVVVDDSQAIIQEQPNFNGGVQTPLSNLGSKLQTLYRYADFGWSLSDLSFINVDVEGIAWAPVDGQPVFDSFDEFQISLAHCDRAPDEWVNPGSFFPDVPNSGLRGEYDNNQMNGDTDPLRIVHPRERGYTVNPGDLFATLSGSLMMPYPFNRDVPLDEKVYYTWRDSSFLDRTAALNNGVPPRVQLATLGIPVAVDSLYNQSQVQTIGLPLLMEFRCYPDDSASGLNSLDVNLASNSSSRPFFRAFSTGGVNTSNNTVTINPDLETKASGGFNPTSSPTTGEPTFGRDNTVYLGALDIVIRVSRSVSIWFPATDPLTGEPFAGPTYNPAVIEPTPDVQPIGTSVEIAYRGATDIEPLMPTNNADPIDPHPALANGNLFDVYGNFYFDVPPDPGGPNTGGGFFPQHNPNQENRNIIFSTEEEDWEDSVASLNLSRYYQLRLTFVSNEISELFPVVSAVALAWQD